MIKRNIDNIVLYNNEWHLSESGCRNEKLNLNDASLNNLNATKISITEPFCFVGGHYTYDGEYHLTELGLAAARDRSKITLMNIRLSRAFTGTPYDGNRFGSDENDISAIVSTATNVFTGFLTMEEATGGYWKSANNGEVEMTKDQFLTMAKDLSLFLLKNKRGYHAAKDAIAAAKTEDEINAIIDAYKSFDPLGE